MVHYGVPGDDLPSDGCGNDPGSGDRMSLSEVLQYKPKG
jgi:hypothetical protein